MSQVDITTNSADDDGKIPRLKPDSAKKPADLYDYIRVRHLVFCRRGRGLPPDQWTTDRVLRTFKLENVYRELDRGSRVVIVDILGQDAAPETILWNVIRYRVFNYPEVFALTGGFMEPQDWNVAEATSIILPLRRRHNMTAYRIPASGGDARQFPEGEGQTTKLWCWRLGPNGYYQTRLAELTRRLRTARTPQGALGVLMEYPGLGGDGFTAYQIYLDLLWSGLLPFSEDDWTHVGPGAQEALVKWMGLPPTEASVRRLWAEQPDDLPGPRLSLTDIQYSLCGSQKYWRQYSRSGKLDLTVSGPFDPRLWPKELLDRYILDVPTPEPPKTKKRWAYGEWPPAEPEVLDAAPSTPGG